MRRVWGILIGGAIGAGVGYSQIFCPDGQCALTGSWFGGALLGAWLGMLFSGGGG